MLQLDLGLDEKDILSKKKLTKNLIESLFILVMIILIITLQRIRII